MPFWRYFGDMDYSRFIVICSPRTGSNYLMNLLNTNKQIQMYSEILAPYRKKESDSVQGVLERIFSPKSSRVKAVGFKLFYKHLEDNELSKVIEFNNINYIHLKRKNKLRTIVSLEIAKKTNVWQLYSRENTLSDRGKSVFIDPHSVLERISELENYENTFDEIIKDFNHIQIFYENFTAEPEYSIRQISDFLHLDMNYDYSAFGMRKQNPEKLSTLIENYDAVAKLLSGNSYEKYLEE